MSAPSPVQTATCPLCRKPGALQKKAKRLYGGMVCKKCYYKFANRRQGAYLVDVVVIGVVGFFIGYYTEMAAPIGGMMTAGSTIFEVLFQIAINIVFFMKDGFGDLKQHSR